MRSLFFCSFVVRDRTLELIGKITRLLFVILQQSHAISLCYNDFMRLHVALGSRSAFTLIELLVVIAIIAILAIVVVLTLNPAELLRQARDSNRISDLTTINSAINLYNTDQSGASGYSLGMATTTFISISDPNASTTAGDQCQGLGIATSSSYVYHCAASSTFRQANNTGWVPVAFANISAGSPFGALPVDPVNTTSSGDYYAYLAGPSAVGTWELVARLESQKYASASGVGGADDGYSAQYAEAGKDLALALNAGTLLVRVTSTDIAAFDAKGLVGYWPMDEGGSGLTTADISGNGNTMTWHGAATGTNGYYSLGKVGPWAGAFDGATTFASSTASNGASNNAITISAWMYQNALSSDYSALIASNNAVAQLDLRPNGDVYSVLNTSAGALMYFDVGAKVGWHLITVTWSAGNTMKQYRDGVFVGQSGGTTATTTVDYTGGFTIGRYAGHTSFNGLIDEVRVYNRALSATEVQALYNVEK